jgi:hypothetical protein
MILRYNDLAGFGQWGRNTFHHQDVSRVSSNPVVDLRLGSIRSGLCMVRIRYRKI